MVGYLPFQASGSILSICISCLVCKAQCEGLFLVGPIHSPPAGAAGISPGQPPCLLHVYSRAFPLGGPPHSRLQPLSLLLADKTILVGSLCLRACKGVVSRFSPSPHSCSAPVSTRFMDPTALHRSARKRSPLGGYSHFPNLEGGSSVGHQHTLF